MRKLFTSKLQAHMAQFGASTYTQARPNSTPTVAAVTDSTTFGEAGVVSKTDYSIVSASMHKIHRNNVEKVSLNADGSSTTASMRYNAFISHAIPRSNNQYACITASIIS